MKSKKIILVGKGGSGKTTIQRFLNNNYDLLPSVSYTTRKPRDGEIDGVDYNFINKEKFLSLLDDNYFYQSNLFNDEFYGTSLESLKKDNVFIVTPNRISFFIGNGVIVSPFRSSDITIVYLKTNDKILESRLLDRYDDYELVKKRIKDDQSQFSSLLEKNLLVIDTGSLTIEETAQKIINHIAL